MEPSGFDVVVRLYDPSELQRLVRCLFALFGQSLPTTASPDTGLCEPLRLHLMLRRFTFAEVQSVRTATRALRPLDETMQLMVHNWELPEPFDLRVPLLNWGLETTKGRYFTCCDVSDLIIPGAYAKLLMRLRLTKATLALGGFVTQQVRWWGDVVLPLRSTLPCPGPVMSASVTPPVFLLDRARVPLQELVFQVGIPDMEVVDLVKRLSVRYLVDNKYITDLLAVRQLPD